jgi:hypothetical protein
VESENERPLNLVFSQVVHVDQEPEEHIGKELIDPWVDPEQTDWPMADEIALLNEEH